MILDPSSATTSLGIICTTSNSMSHDQYWILYSGANDHVCFLLQSFTYIHNIKHIKITLPNGDSIMSIFSSTFYLHNILYSDGLHLNLIFISKLCQSLHCKVNLYVNEYFIQDLSTMRIISLGKKIGGLYRLQMDVFPLVDDTYLLQSHFTSINTIFPSNALCHFRLGHVLNKNIKLWLWCIHIFLLIIKSYVIFVT